MDYFAHGLWSYIIFHSNKRPIRAVIFGLLPDTLSWFIFAFYAITTGQFGFGPPNIDKIPSWVFVLYGISHSLIICILVILCIFIIFKKVPVYIYAWPIAIIMDVFTHTRRYLPTPFLFPLSEWKFPGIRWSNVFFITVNYISILSILLYFRLKKSIAKFN